MTLTAKATKQYQNLLRKCFATDAALVNIFHIKAGHGVKECAADTYNTLKDLPGFDFYALYDSKEVAGYFGMEIFSGNFILTGFFLTPKYRTPEAKEQFWKLVLKKAQGPELFCGLYKKNDRARKFLLKKGFEVVQETTQDGNIVQLLKLSLCQ